MLNARHYGENKMKRRISEEQDLKDQARPRAQDERLEADEQDAEGHMYLPSDHNTAKALAQGRSAEMEREARERRREKESRPNRR